MNTSELTTAQILSRLQQRVSPSNAKLLLDSALVQAGLFRLDKPTLEKDEAKALVMKLINQGGPSFQVGQALYKEYIM